jgi:hypothetical protein
VAILSTQLVDHQFFQAFPDFSTRELKHIKIKRQDS